MSIEMLSNGSERWSIDPGEPKTGQPRISITPQEGRFLRRLFRGELVLEIGTGLGVATCYLSQSARWVHTVDNDRWVWETVVPSLVDELPNVMFHDNRRGLEHVRFGGAFIDGSHQYWDVRADFEFALSTVQPGHYIVMHDAGYGDVKQAVTDCGYTWHHVPTYWQLGVVKCKS